METPQAFRQRTLREKRLTIRLRLATTRVEEADRERIWAIATAHTTGLDVAKPAAETGPVTRWQRDHESVITTIRITSTPDGEVEVLRWCIDWLGRRNVARI
jgi:hypothetical protein